MKQCLVIDGGGSRAIIPLQVLCYVEALTGRPCRELFDEIWGTSAGGIVAIALAQGVSARRCRKLFLERASEIFPPHALAGLRNLADPRYPADSIERVLMQELSSTDEWPCAFVTAYDTHAQHLRVLGREYGPAWLRARATSAAPTYFPPVRFGTACLVDGGIIANDPVLVAACASNPADTRFLSLGTGRRPIALRYEDCAGWGTLQWAGPLIDAMLTGSQGGAEYVASRLLPHYTRVDCALAPGEERMDATDQGALLALHRRGQAMLSEHQAEINAFCASLTGVNHG